MGTQGTLGTVLEGVDVSIGDNNDSQTVKEIADIKDSTRLHEKGQDTKDANKPEDTPAHTLEPSPPSPFEGELQIKQKKNCLQYLCVQSVLIA